MRTFYTVGELGKFCLDMWLEVKNRIGNEVYTIDYKTRMPYDVYKVNFNYIWESYEEVN